MTEVRSTVATAAEALIGSAVVACTLVQTTYVERVWSRGPRRDPDWKYRDTNGHDHHAVAAGGLARDVVEYPTLSVRSIPVPCNDPDCICDGEGYTRTEWRCRECGALVALGLIYGEYAIDMPHGTDWRLEVRGPIDGGVTPPCTVRISTIDGRVFEGEAECTRWVMGVADESTWEGIGELRAVVAPA